MNKLKISVVSLLVLILFTTCSSVYNTANTASDYSQQPTVSFPSTEIEIPRMELTALASLSVVEEEDLIDVTRIDITEDFTWADKASVTIKDPKLFATEDRLLIDLSKIKESDYAFPLPGAKLLSEYAGRRKNHTGVDLKVSSRDTIVSAFDGVVRMSKPFSTYGNIVVVRHYNGLETVYSHNTKNLVKEGDRVRAGEAIAISGRTGRATTDHLHFEVRVNGQHFDPALVFDMQTYELRNKTLLCVQDRNKISVSMVDPFPYSLARVDDKKEKKEIQTL